MGGGEVEVVLEECMHTGRSHLQGRSRLERGPFRKRKTLGGAYAEGLDVF